MAGFRRLPSSRAAKRTDMHVAWTPDRRSFLAAAAALSLGALAALPQDSRPKDLREPDAAPADGPLVETAGADAQPAPVPARAQPPGAPSRDQVIGAFSHRTAGYWGLAAPGVLSRLPAPAGVALTFDFCGGPGGNAADTGVLTELRRHGVPATLFLNHRWIAANASLAAELAADPLFELANHGTSHRPLSVSGKSAYNIPGTRNPGEVYDEIMTNDARIAELTGKRPLFFRPGTAYLDDVSAQIVHALGVTPVGFSVNGDAGATLPAPAVTKEISGAHAGDIVISHANHPAGGTAAGLARALDAMKQRGEVFVHLPRPAAA